MEQAFMFSVLDNREKEIVIMAMEEKNFAPGDWVIKQGEEGDCLYVID
jgi:cAMP-dependent protein kinase regulator